MEQSRRPVSEAVPGRVTSTAPANVAPAEAEPCMQRGHPVRRLVIAVDGPSGSGKSTVARSVARTLGLRYLDTGAMYRALTWAALERRVDVEDATRLGELAATLDLRVSVDAARRTVSVDGTDVSAAIRTRVVTNAVSAVSAVPAVRAALARRQREIIGSGGIVVEGRDIGTVVAPDAQLKVYLTASSGTRAERRIRQLVGPRRSRSERAADLARTRLEMERRDRFDSSRVAAPLARADDAVEIDSTGMSVADVVADVVSRVPAQLRPAGTAAS